MREPVGILLAAGLSVRFGGDKLLQPLADGTPMGVAAGRTLRSVLERVVAVVRDDGLLAAGLRRIGVETLLCPDAGQGMGASLAFGVASTADAGGWIVALGDMPFVQPATVKAVADALRAGASMAAPVLPDGRRGHPVGFGAQWGASLRALAGERGARDLLEEHAALLRLVPTLDAGCIRDVDRRQDLDR
jgi:molybdenum cofactor cytidylyltransferase